MTVKLDLPLCDRHTGGRRTIIVEAAVVDVAPHLAHVATFAIHRAHWVGSWRISNVESGCCIRACDRETRAATIAAAIQYLALKSEEDVIVAFRGLS